MVSNRAAPLFNTKEPYLLYYNVKTRYLSLNYGLLANCNRTYFHYGIISDGWSTFCIALLIILWLPTNTRTASHCTFLFAAIELSFILRHADNDVAIFNLYFRSFTVDENEHFFGALNILSYCRLLLNTKYDLVICHFASISMSSTVNLFSKNYNKYLLCYVCICNHVEP